MNERISKVAVGVADPFIRLYWKAFKPRTYGVKGLIYHPEEDRILLIRQTYGDTERFTMPGGGYRPTARGNRLAETPVEAIEREVDEELQLPLKDAHLLYNLETRLEGKRDQVTFLGATALTDEFVCNHEVTEAIWTPADLSAIPEGFVISRFIVPALAAEKNYRQSH